MKRYQVYFSSQSWDRFFARDTIAYLSDSGYGVESCDKQLFAPLHDSTGRAAHSLATSHSIAVQNVEDGRYFVISHIDTTSVEDLRWLLESQQCIGLLKCQFRQDAIPAELRHKVSPFTYKVRDAWKFDRVREDKFTAKHVHNHLYFKGNTKYGRKAVLEALDDVLNPDFSSRNGRAVSTRLYCLALSQSIMALSLPGNGNLCHRELEAMALGVPVLQPELVNQYYNPLLPEYHYLSVPPSVDPMVLADRLRSKYLEHRERPSELREMTVRARQWFSENIAFPANMVLLSRILKERFDYCL